ncbi:autotransporter assembly complex protein TamA [Aureimonas jatrophae]|uniref:Autotransporter secretion outer membrane protein TamA n=1 Tax=Aureimonas jatrophae TaxID=1166073 RepID=A0A1H0DP27_9HYPH|nr:autotransporter assembly complex family protein [Aureimonas jatrophae]MBB3951997.1 translocation and assembly module TamA [Aureimonas jatrophae]SDN71803.1 autotransporter secretion outer membrane protein TamA [Aureimonas jatrophae]
MAQTLTASWLRVSCAALLLASTIAPAGAQAPTRPAASPLRFLDPFNLFTSPEVEDPGIPDPVRYEATLTVMPDESGLQDTLERASALVADEAEPVSGSLGLLAKARTDRRRIVAALYEAARYDGLVQIRVDGRDIATLEPDATFDTSRTVPVEITVDPGPLFTIGRVAISGDDRGPIDPAPYGLTPGSDAGSVRILAAEGRILTDLRDEGRPFVALTDREVVADSATRTIDVALRVSPGGVVPFGQTYVEGTSRMNPGFVAYMAGIQPGETYSVAALEKARKRLVGLNVFSTANVKASDAQADDGTLPVQLVVAERKRFVFGAGATFSNTEGAGANAYWEDRNVFGRAESLRIEGKVARIGAETLSENSRPLDGFDYAASATFRKPGVLGPDSVYIGSLSALREQPLAYDREAIVLSNGVEYRIDDQQTATLAVVGEYAKVGDYFGENEFLIASVPGVYTYDGRDNELNPTKGFLAKLSAEPAYEIENGTFFAKARGDVSAYLSFDDAGRFVAAGRVSYGAIVGADLEEIPNNRRFYAGGGGSVRGYAFQSIGPYTPPIAFPGTNPNFVDTPIGGLSVFEASAELRFRVTENIQIVPFVDGGTVGDDLAPDFGEFKLGAGVGARYITSFGPIRVDVALPLDPGPRDSSFQIYAGIGQAF